MRLPDPSLDIGEDVAKLFLSPLAAPSILSAAGGDVAALAIGAEAEREHAPGLSLPLDDLTCCLTSHHGSFLPKP